MKKRLNRNQSELIFEYKIKNQNDMSNQMMIGSICLSDIPKDKVVVSEKNGKKYLNVVLWINAEPDKYGNNASIQVGLSKEEREDKIKPTYIGNLKYNKGKSEGSKSGDDFPF
jgi:hypothetical protein